MELAFVVAVVVVLVTIAMGVVGYIIDRSTERHADKGNRQ
jgi:hypothetical protein